MPGEVRDPRRGSPAHPNPPQARPLLAHGVPVRVYDVQVHKALVGSYGEEATVRRELDFRDALRAVLGPAVLLQARVQVEGHASLGGEKGVFVGIFLLRK